MVVYLVQGAIFAIHELAIKEGEDSDLLHYWPQELHTECERTNKTTNGLTVVLWRDVKNSLENQDESNYRRASL